MTAAEALERYKHMDAAFSEPEFIVDFKSQVIHDLWQAVKTEARKESHEPTNP